jgi:hypothetical protein
MEWDTVVLGKSLVVLGVARFASGLVFLLPKRGQAPPPEERVAEKIERAEQYPDQVRHDPKNRAAGVLDDLAVRNEKKTHPSLAASRVTLKAGPRLRQRQPSCRAHGQSAASGFSGQCNLVRQQIEAFGRAVTSSPSTCGSRRASARRRSTLP